MADTRYLRPASALIGLWLSSASASLPRSAEPADVVPLPQGPRVRELLADEYARRDPRRDGWPTEVANEELTALLKGAAHAFEESVEAGVTALAGLAAEGFVGTLLRPSELEPVSAGAVVEVGRAPQPAAETPPGRGTAALRRRASELVGPLGRAPRLAFKIVRIEATEDGYATRILYSGAGEMADGRIQQNAVWRAQWTRREDGFRLARLELVSYEEVRAVGDGPFFADVTDAVLGDNPSYREQLLPGLHHWWRVLDKASGVTFRGYQGLAVGDANGDGLDDLYVAQPGGLPDRLYVQRPDGTAEDRSHEAGIDYLELTKSALFVDLDGDGDQDLALVKAAHVVVLANDGTGRFSPAALLPLPGGVSVAAADADLDGDLDLYGCAYRNPDEGMPPLPYHDARNGEPNRFFRNDGAFHFTEATASAGLDDGNDRFSFAAAWEDADDDGDPDLYVANDFGRNNLYRNEGGRFRDVAAEAGVEDVSAGMGVTWSDADGDGDMDLYVSNMFSSAGGRVAYQRQFHAEATEATRALYRRHARGNSLFLNAGDGTFTDASVEAGVNMGRWAWGSLFVDLDNDGREDLVVPNGYLTNEAADDL